MQANVKHLFYDEKRPAYTRLTMTQLIKRSTAEKIGIYQSLFMGLRNVYGTYDLQTGKVRQVKEPVTDKVLYGHLTGKQSYGVYLLVGDKTGALAVDFDEDDLAVPIAYVAGARRYSLSAYIERSKSKGYHVWIFFENGGVSAFKARLISQKILTDMGRPTIEIFPKQDSLTDDVTYGNFINAPLFGKLVPKGRTVFMDPAQATAVYPDQWELLNRVQRVPEYRLNAIIESCKLTPQKTGINQPKSHHSVSPDSENPSFGLPPCMRKMLTEGVTAHQRVACFRLAVRLKHHGFPCDLAIVTLKAWAQKNRPQDGKRIITDAEIETQTKSAFESHYRSVGCEDPAIAAYCDPNCPLYERTKTIQ